MEKTDFLGPPKVQEAYNIFNFLFLMENSILKIFGSVDVKIIPVLKDTNSALTAYRKKKT